MKTTPETPHQDYPYSITAWSTAHAALKGTDWDQDDFDNAELDPAIERGLKLAYQETDHDEDGALAVLKAARQHANSIFLTAREVGAMAENFVVGYPDFDYILDRHLEEMYSGLNPDWLNDRGLKGMADEIKKDSEIWIDESDVAASVALPGVWVFTKPGYTR